MIKRPTRILRLKDRRALEYAEYGDPRGKPVMYFHGFCGSCHQASFVHALAQREGIRLIATNRPGIGRSSPANFSTMTEYAGDIQQLADVLEIETFSIIGASGGGCFALACAYALPKKVSLACIFGGIGPLNVLQNIQQIRWFRRLFLAGCHNYPRIAERCLRGVFFFCKRYPPSTYSLLLRTSSIAEADLIARKDVNKILWWDYENVFLKKNGIRALLLETKLYFNWGFDIHDFPTDKPVLFWHGKSDTIVPWDAVRRLARGIRRSSAMLCPGGHLSFLMTKADEIFLRVKHEWEQLERISRQTQRAPLHRQRHRRLPSTVVPDLLYGATAIPRSS